MGTECRKAGVVNNRVSTTKACPFNERFQGKSVNILEQRGLQAFFKSLGGELLFLCHLLHTLNLSDSCLSLIIGTTLTLPQIKLFGLLNWVIPQQLYVLRVI